MRLVLDASVAVAAVRPGEPSHLAARSRVSRVLRAADQIVVPTLFPIEVAAALARAGEPLPRVRAYVDSLVAVADAVVGLGPRTAIRARETAMRWQLRAADAVYVSLAVRERIPLCTLDREVAKRAAAACEVIGP
jgi:predicted nucleic acid-binding protein